MDGKDERLEPIRSFALSSFGLDPDSWRQLLSEEENQVLLGSFFSSQDFSNLFIHRRPEEPGLSLSLHFPRGVRSKVICVSKTAREAISKENVRQALVTQEVRGEDVMSFIIAVSEEVTCPLLSNPETSSSWAAGVAEEALRFMERQKSEALVMKAQIEGRTFLPPPDALHDDHFHGNAGSDDRLHDDTEGQKLPNTKLLHACDSTIIEWAELVSEVLQQDSSQPVVDGLKPLPSEEFDFWRNRLKNLHFIQQQLMSSRAQQVASIVQRTDSIYWSTLRGIYTDVQEGLEEAEDVTVSLRPVQEQLAELQQLQYPELGAKMAAVMEAVSQVWVRSEFYRKPCRVVVLLQEICNLFIQTSRTFLCGDRLRRGLLSEPGPALQAVRLVVRTLRSLKEAYGRCRARLEERAQAGGSLSWDFPSHLVFLHLDRYLSRLHSIQEVLCVSLQLYQLDHMILSGVSGGMWTDVVQGVYQDFLRLVAVLSECNCDLSDPDDQSFELHLGQFEVQVLDVERRLVSVLSRALEACSASSAAAQLVNMFRPLLDRPLIQDQLRPQLARLVELVLAELDHTEQLFHSQRQEPSAISRFSAPAAAALCWTRQLGRRAGDAVKDYRTVQHLFVDSGESQLVLQRFQQVLDLLQGFRGRAMTDWRRQLDSDCGFILDQPLVQQNEQGMLGVQCSHKLEAVLKQLRYMGRETGVQLHPHTARLFTCRDDITQSYLSLSHMVSCYNQVLSGALQVELPLIQDQLQDLNQSLSELHRNTWSCAGVQHLVEHHRQAVVAFHRTVSEARANMDTMTRIVQGWAELHLLQRSGDTLLEAGATEETCRSIREEGQELLRLTQVNSSLYGADASSESWCRYLDHIDDKVQDGLFQLLLRSLHFLSDNMNAQTCPAALFAVRLLLQETGSVFEPSVGVGLSDQLKDVITDVYTTATLLPRISISRHGNYQVCLQQTPALSALEQEVMCRLQQVQEEAERLRAGLDRYSYLWQSDRRAVMQEFLTYGRQLTPEELEAEEAPPTLRDFRREIESLLRLKTEVTHLDDVIVLHKWLQVDLRPFRDALLSLIHDWKCMYTQYLLDSVSDSLQQVTQRSDEDEESSSSSSFPLTETIILLEAAGVELPPHLAAQLQC